MLIPSIDLQGGRIVQLVQGERLALASDDVDGWIAKFSAFPKVQLIDLDAAKNAGNNRALVGSICRRLPCRVGGGVRGVDDVLAILEAGATKVIVGSRLFRGGTADLVFADTLASAVGADRLVAAVDAKGGRVVIDGWRTQLDVTPVEAIRSLDPFFGEFLFTNVDVEGLMQGIDRDAVAAVRRATTRAVTAAGGVTTQEEIDWLDGIGVDAVAGMAIYTGRLKL
ncbi:MAG TPA: HisA/HisF-related TIM barrel protein [Vicinamibacterales bacterium]|jgi:phosphoribosylformimino-5-aminoimidazole carboxamide ribotide isomerase